MSNAKLYLTKRGDIYYLGPLLAWGLNVQDPGASQDVA